MAVHHISEGFQYFFELRAVFVVFFGYFEVNSTVFFVLGFDLVVCIVVPFDGIGGELCNPFVLVIGGDSYNGYGFCGDSRVLLVV